MRKSIIASAGAIILLIVAAICPQSAQARRGETTVGIMGGYTTKNNAPFAGIFIQYSFFDHVRVAPDLGCVFRNKDLDNFFCDVNVHFPFALSSATELYPLVGFSYTSWDQHTLKEFEVDDVSTRANRAGLNLGAGFGMNVSSTLKIKVEAIYTINDGFSTFSPGIGIGYTF